MLAQVIGEWLPTLITGGTGGGLLAVGIPIIRRILGWLDNKNAKQGAEAHGINLQTILSIMPQVVDYVKARAQGNDAEALDAGVTFLKEVFPGHIEALGLSDKTLEKFIKAAMFAGDKLRDKASAAG